MSTVLCKSLALAFFIPSLAMAASHDSLPEKYWRHMDGYKYQYSGNCTVRWDPKSAEFIVPGACSEMIHDRLNADAVKSIEYMRSKSGANNFSEYYGLLENERARTQRNVAAEPNQKSPPGYSVGQATLDAIDLWRQTCVNAKALNFVPFYEMAKQYPGIANVHAARLFSNANNTVKGLGGMVNCAEQAQYSVGIYTADIDIRAHE